MTPCIIAFVIVPSDLTISPNELSKQSTVDDFLLVIHFEYLINRDKEI